MGKSVGRSLQTFHLFKESKKWLRQPVVQKAWVALHCGATQLEVTAKPSLPSPLYLNMTVGLVLTDGMRTEVLYVTLGQCV